MFVSEIVIKFVGLLLKHLCWVFLKRLWQSIVTVNLQISTWGDYFNLGEEGGRLFEGDAYLR